MKGERIMGLSCKPIGKWRSVFDKMKHEEEKERQKFRKEKKDNK